MWHSYPYGPGSELMSAQLPWPIPREMSTSALPCLRLRGQCRADWCPCTWELQTRLFLKPGKQFVLEGCTLLPSSQDILLHTGSVASAEPQFQLGFQELGYALTACAGSLQHPAPRHQHGPAPQQSWCPVAAAWVPLSCAPGHCCLCEEAVVLHSHVAMALCCGSTKL